MYEVRYACNLLLLTSQFVFLIPIQFIFISQVTTVLQIMQTFLPF